MKFLAIDLSTFLVRFYLMMMVVILAGFTGMWGLAFLALPIFLSAVLGVRVGGKGKANKTKVIRMEPQAQQRNNQKKVVAG